MPCGSFQFTVLLLIVFIVGYGIGYIKGSINQINKEAINQLKEIKNEQQNSKIS
jgi:hypothetical protein